MQKKQKFVLVSLLVLAALLVSVSGLNAVNAHGQSVKSVSQPAQVAHGYKSLTGNVHFVGEVDMQKVPKATPGNAQYDQQMPVLTGASAAQYSKEKAAAAHNTSTSFMTNAFPAGSAGANIPVAQKNFDGLANSNSICPYYKNGCQPPDMALASSSQWVLEGVNMSFGVYDPLGNLLSGWPKNFSQFFGVTESCDPHGPFLYAPRAFYDPNQDRFWVAVLQVEGAFGVGQNCPFESNVWFAVTKTNNPNGVWYVYTIYGGLDGTVSDYTQFGFDNHNVYFNLNQFSPDGSTFEYDLLWVGSKGEFEHPNNNGITLYGYGDLMAPDGTLIDTMQPVESETSSHSSGKDALFVSSFNINSGGGNCVNGCSGVILWDFEDPYSFGGKVVEVVVPTITYALAPNADQPGCSQCVETLDTRISATPVYHDGLVTFALETAAQNKSQVVPAIFWAQILPQFVKGHLQSASIYQGGIVGFEGDQAASFGALMADYNGSLLMVYDTMSSAINPSILYTGRHVTDPLNTFDGPGHYLQMGVAPTKDTRWGEYSATSYDGPDFDHIWFVSQYSNKKGDWTTRIGEELLG
jgi:hypothetical protein